MAAILSWPQCVKPSIQYAQYYAKIFILYLLSLSQKLILVLDWNLYSGTWKVLLKHINFIICLSDTVFTKSCFFSLSWKTTCLWETTKFNGLFMQVLLYLVQSRTSLNGMMYSSAATTGIHPIIMASNNAVWPSLAPRRIRQNSPSWKTRRYMYCIVLLTHWPLGDLDVILKIEISLLFYLYVSSNLLMIMPLDECHRTLVLISQHWFG